MSLVIKIKKFFKNMLVKKNKELFFDESGQTIVELAIIIAVVVIGAVAVFTSIGEEVKKTLDSFLAQF
ncbi:MAG: hypothetical protein ACOCP8_04250 [archaeon]